MGVSNSFPHAQKQSVYNCWFGSCIRNSTGVDINDAQVVVMRYSKFFKFPYHYGISDHSSGKEDVPDDKRESIPG